MVLSRARNVGSEFVAHQVFGRGECLFWPPAAHISLNGCSNKECGLKRELIQLIRYFMVLSRARNVGSESSEICCSSGFWPWRVLALGTCCSIRDVGNQGGKGEGAEGSPLKFWYILYPIPIKGVRLCPPLCCLTPTPSRFSDFPMVLLELAI